MPPTRAFKAGDRVGYSRAFLKTIGSNYDTAQRRGVIVPSRDADDTFVCVKWDDGPIPALVLRMNVAVVGSLAFVD